MPYVKSDGTYVYTESYPGVALAARTTSSSTAGYDTGSLNGLRGLYLNVTAATGTLPTLDVTVETSNDNSAWSVVGTAFTQATGATTQRKSFSGLDRYVRITWVIGGTATPTFTFSVTQGELV